jgi:hypothetical protein
MTLYQRAFTASKCRAGWIAKLWKTGRKKLRPRRRRSRQEDRLARTRVESAGNRSRFSTAPGRKRAGPENIRLWTPWAWQNRMACGLARSIGKRIGIPRRSTIERVRTVRATSDGEGVDGKSEVLALRRRSRRAEGLSSASPSEEYFARGTSMLVSRLPSRQAKDLRSENR